MHPTTPETVMCTSLAACLTHAMLRASSRAQASEVNRLLVVPGIIINASRARPQATGLTIRCRNCNHTKVLPISNPFMPVSPPRTCEAK